MVVRSGRKIRVGDKVMQIRNNYDKDVYNGDIGLVTDINTEDQAMHVDIDGNDIVYDYTELDELVLMGTKKALGMAVRNNRIMQRNSWVWGRLRVGSRI